MGLLTTPGRADLVVPDARASSLVALLVADQIYALQNLDGTYAAGGPLDSIYLIAYILFGVAVAHPSMRRLTDPHPVAVTWLGPVRLICLAAAMVTGPLLVTIGPGRGRRPGRHRRRDGAPVAARARPAVRPGRASSPATWPSARALEAQLSYQAFHDPLTGLANRRRFVEQAEAALAARRRGPGSIAALFLDLDDFKTVNDSLGHAAGDELLVAVAARIRDGRPRRRTSPPASAATSSAILLLDIADVAYADERRRAPAGGDPGAARRSPTRRSRSARASASRSTRSAMTSVDDLLGDADVAMYQAKALGKGRSPRVHRRTRTGASASASGTWSEQPADRPSTVARPARLEPGAG